MDPYGNAANQYGQEMQFGVRLQDALNQRQAEMPNQLFDRFMQSYQAQIKQRMLEQQMARQQQHEDAYLQLAKTRQDRADDQAKAEFANWVSKNYKEGRDDGVAVLLGKAAGFDENAVRSMLPKGQWGNTGGGETLSTTGSQGAKSNATGSPVNMHVDGHEDTPLPPLPTGERAPLNITMPQTPAAYQPGMGQGVAYQEGEQARKQADMDRKVKRDALKQDVERAKLAAYKSAVDSRGQVDAARVQQLNATADMINARIESGEFDLKPELMRAQIANLQSLVGNRGIDKEPDPATREGKLYRMAMGLVPKDAFGNRDPKAVEAKVNELRGRMYPPGNAASRHPQGGGPKVGDKTAQADGRMKVDKAALRQQAANALAAVKGDSVKTKAIKDRYKQMAGEDY